MRTRKVSIDMNIPGIRQIGRRRKVKERRWRGRSRNLGTKAVVSGKGRRKDGSVGLGMIFIQNAGSWANVDSGCREENGVSREWN